MSRRRYVLALDRGTTSSCTIVFDQARAIAGAGQREHPQFYPHPGWVEHDPALIWSTQRATIGEALAQAGISARTGLLQHVPDARARAARGELAFGTIDSWLIWNLTGGGAPTSPTSATPADWDDELLALFDIPRTCLPRMSRDEAISKLQRWALAVASARSFQ